MRYLRVVQMLLLRVKLRVAHLFDLLREVFQDVSLQAAQNKRPHHSFQAACRFFILILCDRILVSVMKFRIVIQESGHQEIKDAPELTKPVFYGRSGQCHPVIAVNHFYRLAYPGLRIFDELRLIQHMVEEGLVLVMADVPLQQIVRGNHHIPALPVLNNVLAHRGCSRHGNRFQLRCKPLQFLLPIVHQRCRADDQRGVRHCMLQLVCQQDGDHLQGFSQSHIVRQNARKTDPGQCAHPLVAVDLIVSHDFFKRCRNREIRILDGLEIFHQLPERMVAVGGQLVMLLQHLVQIERPVQRKVHLSFGKFLYRNPHAVHHGLQDVQRPGFLQPDKFPAFQAVVFLLFPIAVQKSRQFVQGHIIGSDRKIHQVALHPDTDLDGRHFTKLLSAEGFGSLHLSVLQKSVRSLRQDAEHLVGAAVRAPGFLLLIVLRKIVIYLLQRLLLLVQIPIGRQREFRWFRQPQHMLPVPVGDLRPAEQFSVLRVKPEDKLRLRCQMLLYFLLIGNPDIQAGIFLHLRQHAIEEFRHFLLADLHLGNPVLIGHFQQRLQLPVLLLRDARHHIPIQQVILLFPLQKLRSVRLQQNPVEILPLARSRNHNRNSNSCLPDFQLLEHGGVPAGHRHILPKLLRVKLIQPAAGENNPVLYQQIPAAEIVGLLTHHLIHQLLSQTDLAPYQTVEGQRAVHKGVRGKGDRVFGSQLQRLVLLHLIHQVGHILQDIHFGIPDLKRQLQARVFHENPRFQNNRLFSLSAQFLLFDCALSSDSFQKLRR